MSSTPSRPAPRGTPTQQGHPVYSNDQNVMIRGVHDAIAHLGGGHPFSARGEYGAYNRHLKTLCNVQDARAGRCLAAAALFTEIVGQTSYYYVYGQFAPQKAVFLPDFDHYNVGLLPRFQAERFSLGPEQGPRVPAGLRPRSLRAGIPAAV